MNDEQHAALELAVSRLDEREVAAFRRWQNSKQPPLSPDTQAKLFALFLNGRTTEQIRKANEQFSLGQIVHARIVGEWDRRYQEHIDSLLENTKQRYQQVTLESVGFIADLLAATNKMHGDRITRFIQTGDPKELGDLQINSLQGYKTAVELLQKLTGQDKQQKVGGEIVVTHKADESMQQTQQRAPDSEEAAGILKLLLGKKD
jgi:hypothetical protein